VFACTPEWPGWARAGKDEERALEALALYTERYAPVVKLAGYSLPPISDKGFHVLERLTGNAGTDFGVPSMVRAVDQKRLSAEEGARLAAIVHACWKVLAKVAAGAPAELRKGPRGGGRDRDKILDHVLGAESAYARKVGIKMRELGHTETAEMRKFRRSLVAALATPSSGKPPVEKGWPQRYAARRIAWHALDHAWEIQDRS